MELESLPFAPTVHERALHAAREARFFGRLLPRYGARRDRDRRAVTRGPAERRLDGFYAFYRAERVRLRAELRETSAMLRRVASFA